MSELNRAGTTVMVVTHDPQVSRAVRRVITLHDGRVLSDISLESALAGYLMDLRNSALGQAIILNQDIPEELREIAPQLRSLFERV